HELAIERGQNQVGTAHMMAALLLQDESLVYSILEKMNVDVILLTDAVVDTLDAPEGASVVSPSYQMYITPDLVRVLDASLKIAEKLQDEFVSTEHLFIAILATKNNARDTLAKFNINQ